MNHLIFQSALLGFNVALAILYFSPITIGCAIFVFCMWLIQILRSFT
jgi:Mn2+/Fe2+ NRAMP family transporter